MTPIDWKNITKDWLLLLTSMKIKPTLLSNLSCYFILQFLFVYMTKTIIWYNVITFTNKATWLIHFNTVNCCKGYDLVVIHLPLFHSEIIFRLSYYQFDKQWHVIKFYRSFQNFFCNLPFSKLMKEEMLSHIDTQNSFLQSH